jgi:hypothetical protein
VCVHTLKDFYQPGGVYQVSLGTGIKQVWSSKMGRVFADLLTQSWRVYTVVCRATTYVSTETNKYISTEREKTEGVDAGNAVHKAKVKLEERGERLEELGEQSERLADGSSAFLKAAQGMNKKKSWWQF